MSEPNHGPQRCSSAHIASRLASIAAWDVKTKLIFEQRGKTWRLRDKVLNIDSRGGEFLCLPQIGAGFGPFGPYESAEGTGCRRGGEALAAHFLLNGTSDECNPRSDASKRPG